MRDDHVNNDELCLRAGGGAQSGKNALAVSLRPVVQDKAEEENGRFGDGLAGEEIAGLEGDGAARDGFWELLLPEL